MKPHSLLNRKRSVKSTPREKENSPEDQELDEQLPKEVDGDTSVSPSVEPNTTETKTLGNENVCHIIYSVHFILTKGGAEAIPVNTFPDYLKNMMRKGNKTLAYEYEVSRNMLLIFTNMFWFSTET